MAIDRFPPNETPNDPNFGRRKRKRLKWIEAHTEAELDAAVERAAQEFGDRFWVLLHGIDAYMERRKRRVQEYRAKADAAAIAYASEYLVDPWGNS